MKRAGRVVLVIVLVLAMLWTSTGTSNVMGVFAENLAGVQSVNATKEDTKAEGKSTVKERDSSKNTDVSETAKQQTEQQETKKQQTEQQETEKQKEETKQQTAKGETADQENTSNQTTATDQAGTENSSTNKAAKSGSSTQKEDAGIATESNDSSEQQKAVKGSRINIADCIKKVDMKVTIDGKKIDIADLGDTKVPKGAPVDITVEYDNNAANQLSNLEEGTVLYYQLPEQIELVAAESGTMTDEDNNPVGNFTISKDGLVEITFKDGYLTECGGTIERGFFWVSGNFSKDCGGNGEETIVFGNVKVDINFDTTEEEKRTNLNIAKEITGFDANTETISYKVTVTAPEDNTDTVKDVKVTDVFADNSLKMIQDLYTNVKVGKGSFDTKTGVWTVGDMAKGETQTLTYSTKIKGEWDSSVTDKTIANTATVTAGDEKKGEVTSSKVFNNNLNITKTTVDGEYGTSKGIHVDETGTWIKYTITVKASNINQDDTSGVKVTDIFSGNKDDIEKYYGIEGATETTSTEPGSGQIYIDNTNKDFIWNIGTMKPGETKTLTYCVKLKDTVWEQDDTKKDTVEKKFTNKATLTATGLEEDKSATTTVNLKKQWVKKNGKWDAENGIMNFTVEANKRDNNSPVLDRNFTFTDKLTGDYKYTGKLTVKAYDANGKLVKTDDSLSLEDPYTDQKNATGTLTWNGDKEWTYKPTGDMQGAYTYILTYGAEPTENGHNYVSNKMTVGVGDGSYSYDHEYSWGGTGSEEIALTKEYISGITTGKMKWKTTIPVRVLKGSTYVDTPKQNMKFTSEEELKKEVEVYFGEEKEDDKLIEGTDYTVKRDADRQFTLTFLKEFAAHKARPIVITYYTEDTVDRGNSKYTEGAKFTYTNTGKLTIREGQSLTASDSAVWYKHSSISKEAGSYDKKTHTIHWFITLNKDGNIDGDAEITDTLPEGLVYVDGSAKITERGKKAQNANLVIGKDAYDSTSRKLTFKVTGLEADSKNSNEGYVKIAVDTLVDDDYIDCYREMTYENKAKVDYKGGSEEASAQTTIKNTSLTKEVAYARGSSAEYTLTVNPDGDNLLKDKDTITVVDRMPKGMVLLQNTIKINGESLDKSGCTFEVGTGDKDNNEYKFTVPDDKKVVIKYNVTIDAPEDASVTLSNTAWYEGIQQTEITNKKEIVITSAGAGINGARGFSISKIDSQTQNPIKGAKFTLEKVILENGKISGYEPVKGTDGTEETDRETDENGKIQFTGLKKDGLYCFRETKAASGYKNYGERTYFAFTKAMQELNIGYPILGIAGGATVQVENMPVGSLNVEKKVIGNKIPDDTYQMEVSAAEENVDTDLTKATVTDTTDGKPVEVNTKTAGKLTFNLKAGQKVTVAGLPVGTYAVTEKDSGRTDSEEGYYTAAYSGDDHEKVQIAQNKTSNVIVTNTYKTELYILKKDVAADTVLSGAELAIYNKSDVDIDTQGNVTVKDGKEAIKTWTSSKDKENLTGVVKAGGSYVLVEKTVPTSDYVLAKAVSFTVDETGQIKVTDSDVPYDETAHTITLDNKKKTGSLTVKKVIRDGEADTAFDFTVTFTGFNEGQGGKVTVTRKDKNGTQQEKEETVSKGKTSKLVLKGLTNNETVKISGIPYGTAYSVEEAQQEGYLATEKEGLTGVIGDDGEAANGTERVVDAEATITNTRLTGFTVTKTVTNGQYVPEKENKENKEFHFTVTLTRNDAPYEGYPEKPVMLQYGEQKEAQAVSARGGLIQFTLKDGQSATFSDIPSGVKYKVEEAADADYDSSVKVDGKNVSQSASDSEKSAAAEGTIDKNKADIEFTNTRKLGAFSFTKTVRGTAQDKEQSYAFYVEVDGKVFNGEAKILQKSDDTGDKSDTQSTGESSVQVEDGKITLKDGETAVIENLPTGVNYTVREEKGDRYVTIIDEKVTAEKEGTIEEGQTLQTDIVNQVIHLNVAKTDLTGENEVAGATMNLYKAEDIKEDGTVKEGVEALDSWTSGEDSYHDFGPVTRAGESYVLVETAAPDGYTYAANIPFKVKEDGTIETTADKKEDKESGEDIYLVKDDITRVSIKKTDITGSKEIAGARLLLKDKDGKVIESWMSGTEAHAFEQKLIAGETYTLAEVTAPDGYEVAADITFTVNKDGTISVAGKAVDGNEIIMKDEATPVGEEGKLVVSKLVTYQGKNQAVDRTFYVALFSDADCTKKVSNVKELKCEGAWSAYTVFEHLKNGTYYVAETDEDGNKLESSEICKIEGNGTECKITPTQKTAYAVIENQLLIPGDDFLNTVHNLTVTKNVTRDGEPISEKYSGTFYVSLFTDPYYTNRTGDVKELNIQKGKSTSVTFTDLADGTYYVAETDKDGNPVENSDFDFDVTYDGDITVSFTESNTDSALGITNNMTKRHPAYDDYLDDDSDGGDKNKDKETNTKNSSDKTKKKGNDSKTGDNSNILFYMILAAAALAAGSAEMYRRNRKVRRRNKHDR